MVNRETGEILETFEVVLTDEQRVAVYAAAKIEAAEAVMYLGKLEIGLIELGAERGATIIYGAIAHNGKDCCEFVPHSALPGMNFVIETKNETDWSKMPPVLEFFTPEEKLEAYKPEHTVMIPAVPEHEAVVPAKWAVKGTISKLARRHGDEALAAIDAATFPGKASGKLVPVDN